MIFINRLGFMVLVVLLSGCAVNSSSTKKYIEGNTFVSERLPTVEIQVSSSFGLVNTNTKKRDLRTDTGAHVFSGVKKFMAHFKNESDPNVRLKIFSEYTTQKNWFFNSPNFNNWAGKKLILADQVINGKRFSTAIIEKTTDRGTTSLKKYYSALYGKESKLLIMVAKIIPSKMFESPPYSKEADDLLSQFNVMADKSFKIVK